MKETAIFKSIAVVAASLTSRPSKTIFKLFHGKGTAVSRKAGKDKYFICEVKDTTNKNSL